MQHLTAATAVSTSSTSTQSRPSWTSTDQTPRESRTEPKEIDVNAKKPDTRESTEQRSNEEEQQKRASADCGEYGRAIFNFFNTPDSSYGAKVFSWIILLLIAISVISFILETLPQYKEPNEPPPIFDLIEFICTMVFTVEYFGRFFVVPFYTPPGDSMLYTLYLFVTDMGNIIDLLSILPFYISRSFPLQNTHGLGMILVFRVVRMVRVFRILKFVKYSSELQLFVLVMKASTDALLILIFLTTVALVVCGTMIYFAEMGTWDEEQKKYMRPTVIGDSLEPTPFISIPAAMWWVVTSITTVGYGDLVPTTALGKIIAGFTMFLGILVLALPITIIGSNFAQIYEELQLEYDEDDYDKMAERQSDVLKDELPPKDERQPRDDQFEMAARNTSEQPQDQHQYSLEERDRKLEEIAKRFNLIQLEFLEALKIPLDAPDSEDIDNAATTTHVSQVSNSLNSTMTNTCSVTTTTTTGSTIIMR